MFRISEGIQHAFEPDHVTAIGTQLFKRKTNNCRIKNKLKTTLGKSSVVGIFWGAGHSTTLLIMGFIVYFFTIDINSKIFTDLELLVGFMLIFLGISAIWKKTQKFPIDTQINISMDTFILILMNIKMMTIDMNTNHI